MIDQIRAHARESLRAYNSKRATDAKRPVTWLAAAAMVCLALALSAVSVAVGQDNAWVLLALGVVVGIVGIAAEIGIQRLLVRFGLRQLPTRPANGPAEHA